MLRLELSLVQPIANVPGDQCEPGVYFGAGAQFLWTVTRFPLLFLLVRLLWERINLSISIGYFWSEFSDRTRGLALCSFSLFLKGSSLGWIKIMSLPEQGIRQRKNRSLNEIVQEFDAFNKVEDKVKDQKSVKNGVCKFGIFIILHFQLFRLDMLLYPNYCSMFWRNPRILDQRQRALQIWSWYKLWRVSYWLKQWIAFFRNHLFKFWF